MIAVTTLDFLTAALALFTLLLVGATVYMGKEMRATRKLNVQPELALDLTMISKMVAAPAITNIGAGAALDVDLRIEFVPVGSGAAVMRGWRTRLIVAGERHVFMPPLTPDGQAPQYEDFARSFQTVRVIGSHRDRLGTRHELRQEVSDIAAVQRLGAEAMHLYEGASFDRAAADLGKPLNRIAEVLSASAKRAAELSTPRPPTLARAKDRLRRFVGLPQTSESGFVEDVWWGPQARQREARRQSVARFWVGRVVQRWLA